MASKASMLKNGAKKTGSGLFAGMSPIKEEKEEKTENLSEVKETPSPEFNEPAQEKNTMPVEKEQTIDIIEPEATGVNTSESAKSSTKAKNSRYEKEKFLLLDIRGLRDYVEHMAKAANMSATKYIRNLIELDMQQNMDIYEAHKALEEKLKGRR